MLLVNMMMYVTPSRSTGPVYARAQALHMCTAWDSGTANEPVFSVRQPLNTQITWGTCRRVAHWGPRGLMAFFLGRMGSGLAVLLSSLDLRSQEVLAGSQGGSDISREVGTYC
jgi:hypothetical protein